ncbi:FxSxx-COOH system tetratricopeptide repeat protein [Ktedonospora formicarum]|uniref:Tetratricopeptide repeat protein n=1 Tax=Ktedonospora formicarum TaxID=2778364 RepID=A0A8J3I567_9CHLR|nr:FxSxx-COOH system tetratricopeptide repeat protein [Ktedonospora formicarum]GHO50522.1 tetratricopeptide repeat protein [Ktedonospora formicarum]
MKQEEILPSSPSSFKSIGQHIRWHRLHQGLSQEAFAEAIGTSTRSLRRWEQDLTIPQQIWRERLSQQLGIDFRHLLGASPIEESEHFLTPPPLWSVPYARNPSFIGRTTLLQTLHRLLTTKQSVARTKTLALSGLGGIGKTQAAIEYAYRFGQHYHALFWLAAETAESLLASLQEIAFLVRLPEYEIADHSLLIAATRRWLASHQEWLVIADNVEDPAILQAVLPPLRQGALLFTTRRQALGPLVQMLELPPMSEEEGIALLLSRSSLHPLQQEAFPGTLQNDETIVHARELTRFLEGLPLALDQAGAYLQEAGCRIADYLQLCYEQSKEILAHRGLHTGNHPASVTATVQLSLEQVALEHPTAPKLLQLCAFFSPDTIPEDLLVAGGSELEPELSAAVADPYQFNLILAALRSASLVTRHPETKTISVHRLVQMVVRDLLEPTETRLWSEQIARLFQRTLPDVTPDTWGHYERYLPHILACLPLLEQAKETVIAFSEVLYKAGSYLLARGHVKEAEPLLRQAVAIEEQASHPNTQKLLERLEKQAELYWTQGKYELAEPLLQRVLVLEEQKLDASHLQTAETLSNLGLLYWSQGKYEQAEPLYVQSLHILEQESSTPHELIAITLGNLALLYCSQGKYEQAELLYVRALEIRENQFGPEHLKVAKTKNNLAALYRDQGKYEQAEPLYVQALKIREKLLGSEHPDTASSINNLGFLYWNQGKYEQAEPLYVQALKIREKLLGPEHPDTANSLYSLAILYRDQEKYKQAEPLFVRVLSIQEQQLGPEHPETASSLHALAVMRRVQGLTAEARTLLDRALQIRTRTLGPEHPKTKETLSLSRHCEPKITREQEREY